MMTFAAVLAPSAPPTPPRGPSRVRNKRPKELWISSDDVLAVDLIYKTVILRATAEPKNEKTSDLDIPVFRIGGTSYKLDRSRFYPDISIYCPVLTITKE